MLNPRRPTSLLAVGMATQRRGTREGVPRERGGRGGQDVVLARGHGRGLRRGRTAVGVEGHDDGRGGRLRPMREQRVAGVSDGGCGGHLRPARGRGEPAIKRVTRSHRRGQRAVNGVRGILAGRLRGGSALRVEGHGDGRGAVPYHHRKSLPCAAPA